MSVGFQIAVGFWFVASGASGYERYMMQGKPWRALLDVVLAMGGVLLLAHGIDGAFTD